MPDWTVELRARLAGLRLSPTREAEIVEELSQHLDQRHEELRAAGCSEAGPARVIGAGAVVGLALSVVLGRLLAGLLFGVRPLDPVAYGSAVIVLGLAAAVSIAAPAWRATRVDPAVALRDE